MFQFEQFPVYQLAEELYKLLGSFVTSDNLEKGLKDQLDRASSSIALNIAEGAGKYSLKDKLRYYEIARGSAQETVAILRLMRLRGYITEDLFSQAYAKLELIVKMLAGLSKALRNRLKTSGN